MISRLMAPAGSAWAVFTIRQKMKEEHMHPDANGVSEQAHRPENASSA